MKKALLFQLILSILLAGCGGTQVFTEQPQKIAIWNGKADTKWYKKSQIEFTITTPEQLAGLAKLINDGNDFRGKTVKLGADIMLNDTIDWQNWDKKAPKNKWKPIGTYIAEIDERTPDFLRGRHGDSFLIYFFVPGFIQRALRLTRTDLPFKGTFDGGGFAISGVYISTLKDYQGLFGYVKDGELRNLGVRASYIRGRYIIGGLAGNIEGEKEYFTKDRGHADSLVVKRKGTVNGCYSTAWVAGVAAIGGLVGNNAGGAIISSYSTGAVSGDGTVGGLVGNNYRKGEIINSYSIGAVSGDSIVGGLVGNGIDGEVSNSYSIGAVSGNSEVGGLVGKTRAWAMRVKGIVKNSYYNMETSQQNDSKGIGRVTDEMKQKYAFFGWDFDGIWAIDEKINGGYPYLK